MQKPLLWASTLSKLTVDSTQITPLAEKESGEQMISAAIVLSAILLAFREQLLTYVKSNHQSVWAHRTGLIKYAAASIALASAVSIFPALMINTYMRQNGFFAYEVFQSDQLPFSILSLNAWFVFVMLSLALFSAMPAYAAKVPRKDLALIAGLNVFFLAVVLFFTFHSGRWLIAGLMLIVPFLIATYATFLVSSSVEVRAKKWTTPLAFAVVLAAAPVVGGAAMSDVTARVLDQLNVGGHSVLVTNLGASAPAPRCYFLVLRTNDHLYLRSGDRIGGGTAVMKLESFTIKRSLANSTNAPNSKCQATSTGV